MGSQIAFNAVWSPISLVAASPWLTVVLFLEERTLVECVQGRRSSWSVYVSIGKVKTAFDSQRRSIGFRVGLPRLRTTCSFAWD